MLKILSLINSKLLSYYLFFGFLIIWEIAPRVGLCSPVFIPPFSKVIEAAVQLTPYNILIYTAVSLKRVIVAFSISTLLALPIGFMLAGAFPKLIGFIKPFTSILSHVPPFILFPVFVIVIGVGEGGIYTVILWSSFWPILYNTISGVQQVDPLLIKCARSMKASNVDIFLKVMLPGALPVIMTGIRYGLTMSFMMLIGAETLGADSGLGWLIHNSESMGYIPRLYLGATLVAAVGLAINYILELLEETIVIWKEVPQDEIV